MDYAVGPAGPDDADAIARIYNQGIVDRLATLETRPRTVDDVRGWFVCRSARHPVLVARAPGGEICGWASLNAYNPRECYDGVADVSVYVAREWRGKRAGSALVQGLTVLAALAENEAARHLYSRAGFHNVGTYRRHGMLDGRWVDVRLMELLLQD